MKDRCWLTSWWVALAGVQSRVCKCGCSYSHCCDSAICLQDVPCSYRVWAMVILSVHSLKNSSETHVYFYAYGIWCGHLGLIILPWYWQSSLTGVVLQGKRLSAFPRRQAGRSYNFPCCSGLAKTAFSLGQEGPELVLTSVRCSYICLAGYVA